MSAIVGIGRSSSIGGSGKKLIAWVSWVDEYAHACPGCKQMYSERTPPQTPPCKECREELSEDNRDIGEIYMLTRRQIITGEQGLTMDISIPAIKIAMDLYGVKDQKGCLTAVRKLFHAVEKQEGQK